MTTTNVPTPSFTPTGFIAPAESLILAGVQADINQAFGGNLNFGTTQGSPTNATPQGQLASSFSAIIGNTNDTFLFYSTQTDPAYAEGRMQDAIGRIYFIERIGATSTVLTIQCVGAVDTIIPAGSQLVDPSNNLYTNQTAGTIGLNGTVTIEFDAVVPGFLPVPPTVQIYQAVNGWDTVTISSGVAGQNTESRSAFEIRRGLSTAANSQGSLPSILGALLNTPGVANAIVLENVNSSPLTVNGTVISAHSIYVCTNGGAPQAIGQAIWAHKAPGCGYSPGNTTVVVQDTSAGYTEPFPSYNVTFSTAQLLPLVLNVDIVNSSQVPANAATLVGNAVVNALAGNPNNQGIIDGPQATIGSKIWASRFIPPISALGQWAQGQIISIGIGSFNNPDAAFATGSCVGQTLTITAMTSGTITIGQSILTIPFLPGTLVASQVSGTTGGVGVYTVSVAQTTGVQQIAFANSDQDYVQVQVTQMPVFYAANVFVTFV